jgi:hypothetical protein
MQVPNTLDLTARAGLAVGHMVANHDHATGYPYFYINIHQDPPVATHNAWDLIDVTSRYIDALILAREMTGDERGRDVEARYRELLISSLDPKDGLSYRPANAWSVREAEMFDQTRALTALVTWYMKDMDPEVKGHIDRLVQGLWNIGIHISKRRAGYSYCYYPYPAWYGDGWNPAVPGEPAAFGGGSHILPLVKAAEATGSEQAMELARRFVHYMVDEATIFRPDGSWWPDEMHLVAGHFHTRTLTLVGVLRYALIHQDRRLVEWVKRGYDFAKKVSGEFGWFPEGIGTEDYYTTKHSETCNITDMLHLALKLAEAGYEECWQDAERFIRNHLMESQWSREDWLKPEPEAIPEDDAVNSRVDMHARILGGFAGRTLPHEFSADGVFMGCCCGAGPRALFLGWDHVVTRRPEGLFVNLRLNRFSNEADVLSWLPHEGRIEVQMRSEGPLFVRVPETDDSVTVNGQNASFERVGDYLRVEAKAEDTVEVRFQLEVRDREIPLYDWKLETRWRGDTVVSLKPSGGRLPLYQREHLDTSECAVSEVEPVRRDPAVRW